MEKTISPYSPLNYTERRRMPYIPMTEAEKRAIVKQKLEKLNIPVDNDDTWLDVQILAKQNGLDITQLLKPVVPDHMMMDKNSQINHEVPKPVQAEDVKPKVKKVKKSAIGFTQSVEPPTSGYTL